MDAATTTTIIITMLAIIVLVNARARRRAAARRHGRRTSPRSSRTLEAVDGRITLDVPAGDLDDAALRRLATGLAERALDRDPSLQVVEVVDLDGHHVLRLHRAQRPRIIALPESLHEPRLRPRLGPSPIPHGGSGGSGHSWGSEGFGGFGGHGSEPAPGGRATLTDDARDLTIERVEPVGPRAAAARFDLPVAVWERIEPDADHVSVLDAILTVAGHPTSRDGDMVLLPQMAFVVVDVRGEAERALARAYLRLRQTGRAHGVVIRQGYVDPALLARRASSAPDVVYTDTRALQRMADATALGLNPLDFIRP